MFASTFPIALCLIGLVYALVMQKLGWRWLCYGLMMIVAISFLRQKTVHMQYIGIEVAAFGILLTFLDPLRFVRNRPSRTATTPGDAKT